MLHMAPFSFQVILNLVTQHQHTWRAIHSVYQKKNSHLYPDLCLAQKQNTFVCVCCCGQKCQTKGHNHFSPVSLKNFCC